MALSATLKARKEKKQNKVSVSTMGYNPSRKQIIFSRMKKNKEIYLMLIPVMAFFIIFSYVPMYGILIAWKDYLPKKGIIGSEWVGWKWFEKFFKQPEMLRSLKNTLIISFLKILVCLPAPVILALLINEVHNEKFKKFVQWAVYLPYFINWVVIGGIIKQMLAMDDGLFNNIRAALGLERIPFLLQSKNFYTILLLAELWKGVGWGTVIYTAGISGIDQSLYEAAKIDGCNRFQLVTKITFPSILPLITVMLIMQIGNIMNAGFDSVYNLYNDSILDVSEIIDTLIYDQAQSQQIEFSTAVGLFKNVINFILLIFANYWTKKINGYSMYSLD